MMKYRKQLLTMSLLLLVGICALNAQVKKKVGDNNTRIDASAVFEIESTTQGFLPPRMTKVEMLAITNPVEGLMVYCTTCSVKSLFAYSGTDWLNIVNGLVDGSLSSNGTAGVSSYSSIGSTGTLKLGTAVSGVTQTINATVSTAGGTYSISTGAINGVTFAGSGTFPAGGSQDIVLTATGTPSAAGSFTYAISGSPTVSFSREAIDPSSAVASYADKAAAGTMTLGTAVSGVTQTITANVTRVGPYNISTTAINGITFAGSGSYGATGNQDIILTASGTPSAGGSFTYAISGSPTVSFSREAIDPSSAVASYVSKAAAGTMTLGTAVSGVTQTITANVTRVGPYNISTITSNGIIFAGSGSYSVTGNQDVILTASGTPSAAGTFSHDISGIPTVRFSRDAVAGFTFATVTSSTSKIWMDRNLGAEQVATSITDAASYGDLYQWGRGKDGHQIRTSATTTTLSDTDQPNNPNFILAPSAPYDWRSGQNNNLWQGVNGNNNPCPVGFRVPTSAELSAEVATFSPQYAPGAFNSVLKLPMPGFRSNNDGSLVNVDGNGDYWSSTVGGTSAGCLLFSSGNANMSTSRRAYGFSVRCLKDGSSVAGTSAVASYVSKASSGTMTEGIAASGVTQTITANVTREGPYNISTTAVNGITFAGSGSYSATGNQDVTLTASGTPSAVGTFSHDISGSPTVSFSRNAVPAGFVATVTSSTSRIWMDRNLGAAQVAMSSTDAASYGDLYQWGRGKDGHQIRTSATTRTLSNSDQPGNANFIVTYNSSNYDWRLNLNNNLWQGVNGTNNPCPVGFRVPTIVELQNEINTFSSPDTAGAFNSVLKLPLAGGRNDNYGSLTYVDSSGLYWSSTVSGREASIGYFDSSAARMGIGYRANGFSVRCLKD
jgi:hypothetical protein